jgi:RNA polymerase sigma-70 factor, ECF subfamily
MNRSKKALSSNFEGFVTAGSLVRILLPCCPEMMISPKQLDDSVASDQSLADRARRGSGAAFAALVTRHREAVYAITRNMCATSGDAEEALKQAFLSTWRELASFPAGAKFTTWLYRIAMKTALAERQRDPRRASGSLEPFLPGFDRAGRLVSSNGRRPELDGSSSERIQITGLLREALECIDDQTRGAFVLRDLLLLPVDEVAAILQTSPQAVRRDAHRARLMLCGFLNQL